MTIKYSIITECDKHFPTYEWEDGKSATAISAVGTDPESGALLDIHKKGSTYTAFYKFGKHHAAATGSSIGEAISTVRDILIEDRAGIDTALARLPEETSSK